MARRDSALNGRRPYTHPATRKFEAQPRARPNDTGPGFTYSNGQPIDTTRNPGERFQTAQQHRDALSSRGTQHKHPGTDTRNGK